MERGRGGGKVQTDGKEVKGDHRLEEEGEGSGRIRLILQFVAGRREGRRGGMEILRNEVVLSKCVLF